jgi:coatomer subunit beta
MWTEFEWENKINVDMPLSSLTECLKYLNDTTHMQCITPEHALSGDCGFLAANVYAKTLFGDDALANVSLEQLETHRITGHVRIRSKTQGIALALGDKISLCQKAFLNPGTVPTL